MAKSRFKKEKAEKLRARREAQARKRKYAKFRYTVTVRHCCGCCSSTLHFRDAESAKRAFEDAGFTVSGIIIDDTGDKFTSVDTFYGYVEGEQNSRSLDYLFGLLNGKEKWP